MSCIKLSLFSVLSLLLSFLEVGSATPSDLPADTFESTPAVWRSIKETPYGPIHALLQQRLISSSPCGSHNRVCAVVHIETSNEDALLFEIGGIFKSNHAYSLNGSEEYDKETLEGQCTKTRREFKESSTQVVSEADPNKALNSLSSHSKAAAALTESLQGLIPLRALEHAYRSFYPFKAVNYQSRLLDSESSLCRLIEGKLNDLVEIPHKRLIRLHLHSDNNSCFYCVQLLHCFAKKWTQETNIPWLIMVSSHQEYLWKGTLPPGNESLQKKSMRTYCNDDRQDQGLTQADTQEYSYAPGKPGKVIQVFMPIATTEAADGE